MTRPCLQRGWRRGAGALVVTLLLGAAAVAAQADARIPVGRRCAAEMPQAQLLGPADPAESVPMALSLRLRDEAGARSLVAEQQRPGSSLYRHWLTPEEFTARFAPTADSYAALAAWLRQSGFTVRTWPNRLRLDFRGPAAAAEDAFAVHMHRYRQGGRRALANAEVASVPAQFAAMISAVRLDTFPLVQPFRKIITFGGAVSAMAPQDMQLVYGASPVLAAGIDGRGETIAVAARSDFDTGDVVRFQADFGLPVREPIKSFPGANPGIGSSEGACRDIADRGQRQQCINGEIGEVLLDVEWARALAPAADLVVAISDTDIDAALQDIVTAHPEAKVISISFGICERQAPDVLNVFAPLYVQAASQGQTVLVATGDGGVDGCGDGRSPSVSAPATDPAVTAVGGTALDPGFDAAGNATGYVSEAVWNDGAGSSAGGPSALVAKPEYQFGPGVPADAARDVPDVSLVASASSGGYLVRISTRIAIVGGTSAATPTWTGIVALLDQASGGGGLGAWNPLLYTLARQQYADAGIRVLHDVTVGDNGSNGLPGYTAGPGFDLATGWGTPDVAALAHAISHRCGGDCDGDGAVTIDELVTGVAIALGDALVSSCPVADTNGDGRVTVDEITQSTANALAGC